MADEKDQVQNASAAEERPAGAYNGESQTNYSAGGGAPIEDQVRAVDPVKQAEMQRREALPREVEAFEGHDEKFPIIDALGHTAQSLIGRLVVVNHDEVLKDVGLVVRAGLQDLPVELADELIDAGKAFEAAGKGHGR